MLPVAGSETKGIMVFLLQHLAMFKVDSRKVQYALEESGNNTWNTVIFHLIAAAIIRKLKF